MFLFTNFLISWQVKGLSFELLMITNSWLLTITSIPLLFDNLLSARGTWGPSIVQVINSCTFLFSQRYLFISDTPRQTTRTGYFYKDVLYRYIIDQLLTKAVHKNEMKWVESKLRVSWEKVKCIFECLGWAGHSPNICILDCRVQRWTNHSSLLPTATII